MQNHFYIRKNFLKLPRTSHKEVIYISAGKIAIEEAERGNVGFVHTV